jgi:ABC-type lipoprotein release transport system permease subunit
MGSFLRIAARNVLRQRRRSLVAAIAVFLGVTALLGVRGVLNGLARPRSSRVAWGRSRSIARAT